MGEFHARDKLGLPIVFAIDGQQPSQTEMARINQYLSGQPAPQKPAPPQPPGIAGLIGGGIASGWNQIQAGVEDIGQSYYESTGQADKAKYWEDLAAKDRAEAASYATADTGVTTGTTMADRGRALVSTAAQSAPTMAAGIAAAVPLGLAGAEAGAFLGPLGATVGGLAGGGIGLAAAMYPQTLEGNVQRQMQEHPGKPINWQKAHVAAAASSAVEAASDMALGKIFGIIGAGGKVLAPELQQQVANATRKAIGTVAAKYLKEIGKDGLEAAITGAAEETTQQGLERWQADLAVLDPKAIPEYLESAVTGGMLESVFGAGAGAVHVHGENVHEAKIKQLREDHAADIATMQTAQTTNAPLNEAARQKAAASGTSTDIPLTPPTPPLPVSPAVPGPVDGQNPDDLVLPPGLQDTGKAAKPPAEPVVSEEAAASKLVPPTLEEAQQAVRDRLSPEEQAKLDKLRGTEPPTQAEGIPFTITHGMRAKLKGLGYIASDVQHLTPAEAHNILQTGKTRDQWSQETRKPQPEQPVAANQNATQKSTTEAQAATPASTAPGMAKVEQPPLKPLYGSETDYRNAVTQLLKYNSVSLDRIRNTLKVNQQQAKALFDEMLNRNDATPTGNKNQYLQVTAPHIGEVKQGSTDTGKTVPYRTRDYTVQPVKSPDFKPFSIEVNGKSINQSFTTQEDAQAFVDSHIPDNQKGQASVVEDNAGMQYGVHEVQYQHQPGKPQKLIGSKLVDTYSTEQEAKDALKGFDPAYSPQSNKLKENQTVEQRQAAAEQDIASTFGSTGQKLRDIGENVIGKGRLDVALAPSIIAYRDGKPIHGAMVEGQAQNVIQTDREGTQRVIRNLITLATDLYSPNLSEEQRTRLLQDVLNHELVHVLRNLDLLSRKEWDTLAQATTQKVPGKLYSWWERAAIRNKGDTPVQMEEEAIAEMLRHYMRDPTAFRNPERGLFQRIADFIKKMIGIGKRHNAEDLMDTIFSGGIANRDIGYGGIGQRTTEDTFYSLLKPDNFFLKSERAVDAIRQDKAPVDQWKGMLKNAGIKGDEEKWLGLNDWLDEIGKDKPIVNKQEIMNFIRANTGIDVKVLAGRDHPLANAAVGRPEYPEMQSQGGQDYAEALFIFKPKPGEPTYQTNHWMDHDNVLAHVRFKTVIEPDGSKTLFIEEMQSDLHQQASRSGGYYSDALAQDFKQVTDRYDLADETYRGLLKEERNLKKAVATKTEEVSKAGRRADLLGRRYRTPSGETTRGIDVVPSQASLDAEAEVKRLNKELSQAYDVLTDHQTAIEEARQIVTDSYSEYEDIRNRMNIPNAPYKTDWEDYVIKRMIRHATDHGFDNVAWHGQPEGVSETEDWGTVKSAQTEKGTSYFVHGDVNVSSIVNRYLEKLPRIVRKLAQRFGAYVDTHEADPNAAMPGKATGTDSYRPPDFKSEDDFYVHFNKKSFSKLYNQMVARQARENPNPHEKAEQDRLIKRMQSANQIMLGMRGFQPLEALKRAGLVGYDQQNDTIEPQLLHEAMVWAQPNGKWQDVVDFRKSSTNTGSTGAVPWKHFSLKLNDAMRETYERGDVPRYSMLQPEQQDQQPQYAATAPLGTRVPINPPIDRLAELHNKFTNDNLSPVIKKLLGFAPSLHEAVDTGIISLQDRMLSVGRLIDRIKKNGGFISNENDTYLRETLYNGQTDAHLTENDRKFFKTMERTIQGLNVSMADYNDAKTLSANARTILSRYPKNFRHALAELYLYAQHAQERNAVMRKRNAVFEKDAQGNVKLDANGDPIPVRDMQYWQGSGMDDNEAKMILSWFAGKSFGAEFNSENNPNSVRSRMRAIVANTNDVRVASDLTPDFRTMTFPDGTPVDQYKDYVPLRGFLGEASLRDEDMETFARTGKGFNVRGKEDFTALGRESLGADLIATAMKQNEETVVRAGKNKVTKSFRQLILDNPSEFDGSKPGTRKVAEILHMPQTKWTLDRERGVVTQRQDMSVESDPTILKGKHNGGQAFYIKLHDDRLVRAFGAKTSLGNTGMGGLLKGMAWLNRWLSAFRTSYNPDFIPSNMLRDLQTALINLSEYEQKGLRSEVIASVLPAMNGIRKALRSGDMTSEWAKTFQEFQHYGGHTAILGIKELSDTIDTINKNMEGEATGAPGKVMKHIKALGKFVEDYNLAVENSTRLAAYKALRDKYLEMSGDPTLPKNQIRAKEMAAFAAKKLTVDFNMGGESKALMSSLYMFYNASMQGSMAMINPFIRSRKMKKIWAGVLFAGVMQDLLMSMLSPTGDDGKKEYDRIQDNVLEHNMIFMDPFGITQRGYFKIPMPYLMNAIFNLGRSVSRAARGEYTSGQLLHTGAMTLFDALNPLGGSNSFLNFVLPTILDPIVDLKTNTDWTGKPIAPPVSPYDDTGINRSQQYWNNTNPLFVQTADWMSYLTGRKGDYIPGVAEVSPNQVEYVLDYLTGGTGMFFARAVGMAASASRGEVPELGQVPVLRSFTGQITTKNDMQSYIEGRDQVMRVRNSLKSARKNGDNEAYMRIMREYPDEYKAAAHINAIENKRIRLATKIRHIKDSARIPQDQKDIQIKALRDRQDKLVGTGNAALATANIQ